MIVPIVEGQGDALAVPVLLRRLLASLEVFGPTVGTAIRHPRSKLVQENGLREAVRLAGYRPGAEAMLILFDADDDCARDIVPSLTHWAASEIGYLPIAVVLARREYESWLLAALESLRGVRRIAADAVCAGDPEASRGAKGVLNSHFPRKDPYKETTDQVALTAKFNLAQTYRRCSSFRKLVKELCRVLDATGHAPSMPEEWRTPPGPLGVG
jgi:hypothetical protein